MNDPYIMDRERNIYGVFEQICINVNNLNIDDKSVDDIINDIYADASSDLAHNTYFFNTNFANLYLIVIRILNEDTYFEEIGIGRKSIYKLKNEIAYPIKSTDIDIQWEENFTPSDENLKDACNIINDMIKDAIYENLQKTETWRRKIYIAQFYRIEFNRTE